jgi:hypothetical protein
MNKVIGTLRRYHFRIFFLVFYIRLKYLLLRYINNFVAGGGGKRVNYKKFRLVVLCEDR